MKPIFLSLFHILAYVAANAQFAIIKDPDGFTNVRAGGSATARIIGKFNSGDVFCYGEEKAGWVKVWHWPADSADTHELEGYIHKDRLLPLDNLKQLPENQRVLTNGHLTLRCDSLTVDLVEAPFRSQQHVLLKNKYGEVEKIDGKRPLGTDGEMPHQKLISLHMAIGRRPVNIPAKAWDNLYDPTLESCNVYADPSTGFIYVHLLATRSAAGGYEMVWIFRNGRYIKRYIDQSNN